jgi:hypothetical protein
MKKLLLFSIILVSVNCFSQTNSERYAIYKTRCDIVDTLSVRESGYLKLDTVVLKTLPTKGTYYGKVIVSKVTLSPTKSIIVTVDTIWPVIKYPKYAFSNTPKPITNPTYDKDKQHWVYRNKNVLFKRCEPVPITIWITDEMFYGSQINNIEDNIDYLKTGTNTVYYK